MKRTLVYLLLLTSIAVSAQHPRKVSILKGGVLGPPLNIVEWNPVTATEPTYASMGDAEYFWLNTQSVGLRNAFHWSPTQYSIPTVGGHKRFRFSVNPRVPDNTGAGHWNYRTEITRDWESGMALGTRDCLAWGTEFPTGGLKNHDEDIDFFQWHSGSAPGYSSNHPCMYGVISRAGTEDDNDDVSQLNEIVVVSAIRNFEQSANPQISGRINTGVVVANGERHEWYMELVSGTNGTGSFVLWHCKQMSPGVFSAWTKVYENLAESTAWANNADGGSNANVHPDWKLGIYCPGIRDQSGAESEEALNSGAGSYSITYDIPGIRNVYVPTTHRFYNQSMLGYIITTNMP
jgi:hypothetical protein